MNHIDDDVLSAYGLDPDSMEDRATVEAHLEECEVCRDGAAAYREIDAALRGPQTWATVDGVLNRNARLEEILGYRRRKEEEERDARALLARVGSSPLKFRNAGIAEKARYHTEGMVRVLCAEANARHEQRPKFSQQIAAAAYAVATKLAGVPDRAKRALMGMALREHANALRYLGRFKDALKLLDYAEKLFDGAPGTDPFDLAIVRLIRATVYMEIERLSDARRMAREVAVVFREYGDVARELSAVMVEACCFVHEGKPLPATESLERAITLCRAVGNVRMLAHALSNCAVALKNLEQFDRAERYCIEAGILFEELEMPTEKTRAEWVLAMIHLSRGNYVESARRLGSIRADLGKLGLTNDATLATLLWAEARLAADRPAGVAEACQNLIVKFENEEMHRHAKRALAVLNEALAAGRGTAQSADPTRGGACRYVGSRSLRPFYFRSHSARARSLRPAMRTENKVRVQGLSEKLRSRRTYGSGRSSRFSTGSRSRRVEAARPLLSSLRY
jgi:tetratricopeptide (TPR) repeat protein